MDLSIEGIPLITRFKTVSCDTVSISYNSCIEGIPLITRFKTFKTATEAKLLNRIEGIPLITRFKTMLLRKVVVQS